MCEAKLGQSRERLREYSFEEVQAANAAGNCWLTLDGVCMRILANSLCEVVKLPMVHVEDSHIVRHAGDVTCHTGMVLDVTRWLPEHPGGSTIIPEQALNIECSRFFEVGWCMYVKCMLRCLLVGLQPINVCSWLQVYHVSRESFLYLKVCLASTCAWTHLNTATGFGTP